MALTTVPASLSATALTLTTAAQPNITSVGTLTGLTVSGNIAGTLTTAAQTNITSLGTLTGLALTGNATITKESPAFTLTDSSSSRTLLHFVDDNNSVVRASGPLLLQSGGAVSALTLDASQNATFAGTIATGGITINGAGSTITDSSDLGIVSGGTLTVDVASEIILDTDDGIIRIRDAGGDYGMFQISNSDFIVRSMVGDKDLIFRGNDSDGGGVITALTLDMSEAGRATFNEDVVASGIYVGSRNASFDFYNNGTGYNNGAFTVDDTLTVTGGVTASRFDATTASTTDPVISLTDSGVADYDFTFPDTSTIQLGTSTTSTKQFKLLNAGSGSFNLDVEGSITSGSTIQGVGTATAAAFQLPWATSAIALRMAYDANYYMSIETHAQTRDLILTSSTNDATANIRFKTSGTGASNLADRMVIDHVGKVFVGAIQGGADGTLAVKTNSNTHAIAIEEASGSENYQLGVTAAGGLGFYNSGSTTPSVVFSDADRVGINTATPQKTFHVEHAAGASEGILICGPSDTSGHTAGILLRAEGGEANSSLRAKGGIFFERTGTFGVGKLHLANNNDNDNPSATIADANLTLDGSGVGLHTTSPQAALDINGSRNVQYGSDGIFRISKNNGNDWSVRLDHGSDDYGLLAKGNGSYAISVYNQPASAHRARFNYNGELYLNGGSSALYNINSDVRLKEEISDAPSQWELVKGLPLQRFKWKDRREGDKWSYGFIAQEVEKTNPEFVEIVPQNKEDQDSDVTDPEYKTVAEGQIHERALAALQEAMKRIEALEAEVKALKGE